MPAANAGVDRDMRRFHLNGGIRLRAPGTELKGATAPFDGAGFQVETSRAEVQSGRETKTSGMSMCIYKWIVRQGEKKKNHSIGLLEPQCRGQQLPNHSAVSSSPPPVLSNSPSPDHSLLPCNQVHKTPEAALPRREDAKQPLIKTPPKKRHRTLCLWETGNRHVGRIPKDRARGTTSPNPPGCLGYMLMKLVLTASLATRLQDGRAIFKSRSRGSGKSRRILEPRMRH